MICALFFILGLSIGILTIYRTSIKKSSLKVLKATVLSKKITKSSRNRWGKWSYGLSLKLNNHQNKLVILLGGSNEALRDSAQIHIDTGNIYKFYIDPTILVTNDENYGVVIVEDSGKEIYKKSNNINLIGGIFISILNLTCLVVLFKLKAKK